MPYVEDGVLERSARLALALKAVYDEFEEYFRELGVFDENSDPLSIVKKNFVLKSAVQGHADPTLMGVGCNVDQRSDR